MNTAHGVVRFYGNTLFINDFLATYRRCRFTDVAFRILHFAFAAYFAPHNNYVGVINELPRPINVGRSV
jgi:hypothetical protein